MTKHLLASCLICSTTIAPAHAQVLLDVAKITCTQFTGYKITNPQNIANWLSGYYNGKRGNTMLDTQGLTANANKLRDYCLVHPEVRVMQAVDNLMASGK
jgi:acid stress chaperone HdeB